MSIPQNGNPWAFLFGADDQSIPPLVPEVAGTPIHLPLMHVFSSKGPINDALVSSGDSAKMTYGRDIYNLKSKYTTINTPYLEMFNALANEVMIQRVVPDDAKTATVRLCIEKKNKPVDTYERNLDGSLKLAANGAAIKKGTIPGIALRVVLEPFGALGLGKGAKRAGTTAGSELIPILDLPASSIGNGGNLSGFSLECLNALSQDRTNPAVVNELGSRLFGFTYKERFDEESSPVVGKTLDGATSISFSFEPGAYYRPLRQELDFEEVFMPAYRKMDPTPGMHPVYGPFETAHVYRQNLETLLTEIKTLANIQGSIYMVDFLTGLDVDGHPYDGVEVDNGMLGGSVMTESHTHYLTGGSDGTMTRATFDALVAKEMNNFGHGRVNLLDYAKYPCSMIWDTGFTVDTKEALLTCLPRRMNMHVNLVTYIAGMGQHDIATEVSLRTAIKAIARAYPESVRYGTPNCRASIVGHSGYIPNSVYRDLVPGSYALAYLTSRFAGAGKGEFRNEFRFDRGEQTVVKNLSRLNLTYKPQDTYSADWEAGLINIRSYDQFQYYFPALYTVYEHDRSILNSFINSLILGDLELIVSQVHRELTGSLDDDAEIVKEMNLRISAKTEGRYDGLVEIRPDAHITARDASNGFSVSCDVYLSGSVMKTVHKYTIIAQRRGGE